MAQLEQDIIAERVKAGLRRAVENGKQLGRPRGTSLDVEAIHRLKSEGLSFLQIAKRVGTSKSSVARVLTSRAIKPI